MSTKKRLQTMIDDALLIQKQASLMNRNSAEYRRAEHQYKRLLRIRKSLHTMQAHRGAV